MQAELAAAGWFGAGWRGQRSDGQGCVPSLSPYLQLPGTTALPDTAALSWQHLEPFPSSQCAHPSVSREDRHSRAGLPPQSHPEAGWVSLSHRVRC